MVWDRLDLQLDKNYDPYCPRENLHIPRSFDSLVYDAHQTTSADKLDLLSCYGMENKTVPDSVNQESHPKRTHPFTSWNFVFRGR